MQEQRASAPDKRRKMNCIYAWMKRVDEVFYFLDSLCQRKSSRGTDAWSDKVKCLNKNVKRGVRDELDSLAI